MIDERKIVKAKPGPAGTYEWTYKPSSDVNMIGVAVIRKTGSEEVFFVLQYKVV